VLASTLVATIVLTHAAALASKLVTVALICAILAPALVWVIVALPAREPVDILAMAGVQEPVWALALADV
jgi:hypothetical protein